MPSGPDRSLPRFGSDDADPSPRTPGRRRHVGRVCGLAGLGLVLLVLAGVALRAVLVWVLVPDRPRDPNAGGLPTCSTVACIDEARTAYVALAVMLVAVSVGVVAMRRPSRVSLGGCLVTALVLIVIPVAPDLRSSLGWAAAGMGMVALGAWLRFVDPVPPTARAWLGPRARHLGDVAAREAVEAWRDAGLPVPRSGRSGARETTGATSTDPPDARGRDGR